MKNLELMEKNLTDSNEESLSFPDHFSAAKFDGEIPQKIHAEYIRYHDRVDTGKWNEKQILRESEKLFLLAVSSQKKKEILFILAHTGTVKCYRAIEKYLKEAKGTLKAWTGLALEECCMFVESYLLDEPRGIVAGGVGGMENRLRCYFLLTGIDNQSFTVIQKKGIRDAFIVVSKEHNSIIEKVEFGQAHALFTALIPIDVTPAKLIENGIRACNAGQELLRVQYFVTNMQKPTQKNIAEYLRKII